MTRITIRHYAYNEGWRSSLFHNVENPYRPGTEAHAQWAKGRAALTAFVQEVDE